MSFAVGRHARAITMWDFSWLERRWAGAGYEDWDRVLEELADRGYDMVRIDAFPHLVSADPEKQWTLKPFWNQQVWGAQSVVTVRVLPELLDFIRAASRHGVRVALSTWFRQDLDDVRMRLTTSDKIAQVWIDTLRHIDAAGLLEHIEYVDLCNEFPLPAWAPFLYGTDIGPGLPRTHPRIGQWMRESIDTVRAQFPQLSYTYSFDGTFDDHPDIDVETFDLLEPHFWMAATSDYYRLVGYDYERYESVGYDNMVLRGRQVYFADQERFDSTVFAEVDRVAEWSRVAGKPLVTTECWTVVDYKDWPGLDWDWVKDLNARALARAAATGRWAALATSNFTGPQFVELWRDVDYHRRLTALIHAAEVDTDLLIPGD